MKILKYVFLLLLLGSIALVVFIATQNGTYTVEKQRVINVSKPVLFNYVTDYNNWQNLGLMAKADTTATYTFSENTAGNGAYMQWQKNGDTGRINTNRLSATDSISQTVVYNGQESTITWAFKDTLNSSTAVKIVLTGTRTFKEKALSIFEGNTVGEFEKTLGAGLDNLQAFLVTELRDYTTDIEGLVTKNSVYYIGHTLKGSVNDVQAKAQENFSKLLAFTTQNNMERAGAPFIIYNNYDKAAKTAAYTFAIPLKNEIFTAEGSEYMGGRLLPFSALKTTLKGDYSHLPDAWRKATNYINGKALVENASMNYVEVYVKTGVQTRRPSQWVTDIYIPVNNQELSIEALSLESAAVKPATVTPATATAKPATTTSQKPSTTTQKPAATGTTKPAATGTQKPNGTSTTTTKPKTTTTNSESKPATTAAKKPAATTTTPATQQKPVTPKPKPAATQKPTQPGDDGMNPPKGR